MKDWKVLVIGFLLGACFMLSLGAGSNSNAQYQISSSADGRYAWVIETTAGRAYRIDPRNPYNVGDSDYRYTYWYDFREPARVVECFKKGDNY